MKNLNRYSTTRIIALNFYLYILSSLNGPLKILQKLITEEDLEELCRNEVENEVEKLTIHCSDCERKTDTTESVLCNLWENEKKIREARHLASKGIQNGAKKMF